jgi:hypothetical protein
MNTLRVYTIGVAPCARAGACRLSLDATADGRRKIKETMRRAWPARRRKIYQKNLALPHNEKARLGWGQTGLLDC